MTSLVSAAATALRNRGFTVTEVEGGYLVAGQDRKRVLSWIELVTMAGVGARVAY